jgi:ABC-type polysaccharide/polyol phosphate export permease
MQKKDVARKGAEMRTREVKAEKTFDLRKVGAIMQKNFIVLTRDKTRLIPLLLFPVFMILVFGYTTGNIPKHIPTALVAYDDSPLSQTLQQEIGSDQVFSVQHVVSTEGEAKRLLDSGKVKVIIEIPPNMQDDIDSGRQAQITIIVDESDSAIASTAHQQLNTLIAGAAARISTQRLLLFQSSVGAAAQRMQEYSALAPDSYDDIAADTAAAQGLLAQSQRLLDTGAQNALLSTTPGTVYAPPTPSGANPMLGGNETYMNEPLSNDAARAQAAALQRTSKLVGTASSKVSAANTVAAQAAGLAAAKRDSYGVDVLKPMATISIFTHSKAGNMLKPLVIAEKPAYGTGKRPVDFLIPAIIALTIFQGAIMGMGRAVAGEKREGSLTRVFLTPTSTATIIIGTLLFYVLFELCRSAFIIGVAMAFFHIAIEGSMLLLILILAIFISVSSGIGMILSSMVKTEQQYMAMSLLIGMPSMFLSGVFFPLQAMPPVLQAIAAFLPITYAAEALRGVMVKGFPPGMILYPISILFVFLALTMLALFMTFKRDIE